MGNAENARNHADCQLPPFADRRRRGLCCMRLEGTRGSDAHPRARASIDVCLRVALLLGANGRRRHDSRAFAQWWGIARPTAGFRNGGDVCRACVPNSTTQRYSGNPQARARTGRDRRRGASSQSQSVSGGVHITNACRFGVRSLVLLRVADVYALGRLARLDAMSWISRGSTRQSEVNFVVH